MHSSTNEGVAFCRKVSLFKRGVVSSPDKGVMAQNKVLSKGFVPCIKVMVFKFMLKKIWRSVVGQ